MSTLPKDIAYIKQHPGKYAVSSDPRILYYSMVEVTEDGTIHQLTPKGERDGVLSDDGWTQDREVRAYVVSESEKTFVRVPQ